MIVLIWITVFVIHGSLFFAIIIIYFLAASIALSLLFAPFAALLYERTALARGLPGERRMFWYAGFVSCSFFVVPWLYLMRRPHGDSRGLGDWDAARGIAFVFWVIGPIIYFSFTALIAIGEIVWMIVDAVAVAANIWFLYRTVKRKYILSPLLVSLGSILFSPNHLHQKQDVVPNTYLPDSELMEPFAWTFLWTIVAFAEQFVITEGTLSLPQWFS